MTRTAAPIAAALSVVLLLLAAAKCDRDETRTRHNGANHAGWPRLTIPRERDTGRSPIQASCDAGTDGHAAAVQTLHGIDEHPECLNAAVEALQQLSRTTRDARVLSDLSAAHHIRAIRDHTRVDDLMSAFEAAEEAVRRAPALAEARFNRALAHEALGLDTAVAAWRDAGAGDRSQHLEREKAVQAATRWQPERVRLLLGRGDDTALARLVAQHPGAAQRYVEEDLLQQWSTATPDKGRAFLTLARSLASQIRIHTGDPFLLDSVTAIERTAPSALRAMQEALLTFRQARGLERTRPQAAAEQYRRAQSVLQLGGSPLAMSARLGEITSMFLARGNPAQLIDMLAPLARTAEAKGYGALQVRTLSALAHLQLSESDYVGAVESYDRAIETASRMRDRDVLAGLRARKAGVLRQLGRFDDAAREALLAVRDEARLSAVAERHLILGEFSENALA
ncbi:MAG TPA: hypothetical protein VHL59_18205, partial [Thermoanaerobaculia bacterium]|nr:hypothetical protein [Thermoanaerobaculia bacterium]